MDIDTFFRLFLGIYLLIIMSTRGYLLRHWSQVRRKKAMQQGFREFVTTQGKPFVTFAILVGCGMMVAIILFFLHPPWLAWVYLPFPEWVRWIGICLGIAMLPLHVWVHKILGQAMFDQQLVTTGPYQRVRHPMFIITGSVLVSMSLIAADSILFLSTAAFVFLMIIWAPREEKILIEEFGEQYIDYMKQAGRFLPKFRSKMKSE